MLQPSRIRTVSHHTRDLTFLLRGSATFRFPLPENVGHRCLDASMSPLFAIIAFLLPAVPVSLLILDVVSLDPVSETFPVKKKRNKNQYSLVESISVFSDRFFRKDIKYLRLVII